MQQAPARRLALKGCSSEAAMLVIQFSALDVG